MNGYELQAEAYKKVLENVTDQSERENLEKKIKVFDFLANCSDDERLFIFDSSAFNSVVKGYIEKACDNLKLKKETASKIKTEVNNLFSEMTAKEALDYYQR